MEAFGILFIIIVCTLIIGGMGYAMGYSVGKEDGYQFWKKYYKDK